MRFRRPMSRCCVIRRWPRTARGPTPKALARAGGSVAAVARLCGAASVDLGCGGGRWLRRSSSSSSALRRRSAKASLISDRGRRAAGCSIGTIPRTAGRRRCGSAMATSRCARRSNAFGPRQGAQANISMATSPRSIRCRVAFDGTPFQSKVWNALRKIPRGTTTSYGALAQEDRQAGGGARGRARQRAEPGQPHRAVPSRHRQQRFAHRLWRRLAAQALAARSRSALCSATIFSNRKAQTIESVRRASQPAPIS